MYSCGRRIREGGCGGGGGGGGGEVKGRKAEEGARRKVCERSGVEHQQ